MKSTIIGLARDISFDEWHSFECPFCERKRNRKILNVKRRNNLIIYHCFSTSCKAHGMKRTYIDGISPDDMKKMLVKDKKSKKNRRFHLPDTFTFDIPGDYVDYLKKYDIGHDLILKYNIGYVPEHKYNDKVIFTNRLVIPTPSGFVARSEYEEPKWMNFTDYNFRSINSPVSDTIVLVEDPLSCIRVGELIPCYCLLGTEMKEIIFINLLKYKKVIIFLDDDKAGKKGGLKIYNQISPYINVKITTGNCDPKAMTDYMIRRTIDAVK